jgi:hypothetical protein
VTISSLYGRALAEHFLADAGRMPFDVFISYSVKDKLTAQAMLDCAPRHHAGIRVRRRDRRGDQSLAGIGAGVFVQCKPIAADQAGG